MPTASGGMRSFFISAERLVERGSAPTPTSAPMPIIFQSRLPPMTPCASAEISVACGAGSGFGAMTPTLAAPAKPYALREQVEHRRDHQPRRRRRRR